MRIIALTACAVCFLGTQVWSAEEAAKSKKDAGPVLKHKMKTLAGKDVELSKYKGDVLLIVNVASKCGATPQYAELQRLHEKYKDKGLRVLGFPCNEFGLQEPGTSNEIAQFCKESYGVTFDMFAKIKVNDKENDGKNQAPLYKYLTSKEAYPKDAGKINWNFEKFLVSRDGKVVGRFRTRVKPESETVVTAIEEELAKKVEEKQTAQN